MADQQKLKLMVLYGGQSGEHEISLRSAASVLKHLDPLLYEVFPVVIHPNGNWYFQPNPLGESSAAATGESCVIDLKAPRVVLSGQTLIAVDGIATQNDPLAVIDVVFPVMHGPLCEDGAMQGLLEVSQLPYVGSRVLASAVSMDKDLTKRIAAAAGIPIVPYVCLVKSKWDHNAGQYSSAISDLGFPLFVKPANMGSSVGVHKVKSKEDLSLAVIDAFRYDQKVLVEKALEVREIEVAVLQSLEEGAQAITSTPGEIIATHEFYSYEAKYLDPNGAHLKIPAELSGELVTQVQSIARLAFETLGCEGLARVDLFLDKVTHKVVFNEVNTLPGFTSISMFPKLMAHSGYSYPQLLSHLVELARDRGRRLKALSRAYLDS